MLTIFPDPLSSGRQAGGQAHQIPLMVRQKRRLFLSVVVRATPSGSVIMRAKTE